MAWNFLEHTRASEEQRGESFRDLTERSRVGKAAFGNHDSLYLRGHEVELSVLLIGDVLAYKPPQSAAQSHRMVKTDDLFRQFTTVTANIQKTNR